MWKRTDEFRTEALKFKEFNYYCEYPVGSRLWTQYWIEQARRCLYGHKRADGSWITGYHYFYLNFSPILLTEIDDDVDTKIEGSVKANRVEGFPLFWDYDADYFHYLEDCENAGKQAVVLKCRGRGYSFKGASMLDRNYFLIPNSRSYAYAADKTYLNEDGVLTKAWDIMDFVDKNTAWGKRRQYKNTSLYKRASYQRNKNGINVEDGFKSEIIGVSLKNNPHKARGKRSKLVLFEEAGSFRNLLQIWNTALPSVTQGRATFGLLVAYGTGGDDGVDFMGLEELFYNGASYKVHQVVNVWDDNVIDAKSGFFHPEWANRELCMDVDGNSIKQKALKEILYDREEVKRTSKNPIHVTRYIAERPLTPQEAILRIGGSEFPIRELKECEANLKVNTNKYESAEYIGELVSVEGAIIWKDNPDCKPIRHFPIIDDSDINGCIVIYEHPVKDNEGFIAQGRYIAGTDPADDDGDVQTNSLLSTFVLDMWTDRLVAEYTGRPKTVDVYFENTRRLLKYYNSQCCYERNKKGLYGYFKRKNALYLLADEPQNVRDLDLSKSTTIGNNSKGLMASPSINKYGRDCINNWLEAVAYGEDEDSEIKNMHKIRSIPLLKELIYWCRDKNFDRVSALGMLMIYREDKLRFSDKRKEKNEGRIEFSKDAFFQKYFNSFKQGTRTAGRNSRFA